MNKDTREAWADWHIAQDEYDRLARISDRLTNSERVAKADAARRADAAYARYKRLRAADNGR